jgi:hypothetical protein
MPLFLRAAGLHLAPEKQKKESEGGLLDGFCLNKHPPRKKKKKNG